jgi:GxxExxY protein
MHPLYEKADALTKVVIAAAVAVHDHFGPGLLESIYVKCLERALRVQGHQTAREVAVPIEYMGLRFEENLRIDLLVDDCLIVEAKAVEKPDPMLFKMQTLTYMKLANLPLGLAINFGGTTLKGRNIWRVILKNAGRTEEPCPF